MENSNISFNKNMLAFCGLYCEQCSFKLAHDENNAKYVENLPFPFEIKDLSVYNCEGCKGYCICGICHIKPCAMEKGFDSCADCDSFPCEYINVFENDGMPHHKTAIENLRHIRQYGTEHWFESIKPSLQCGQCGALQSWYYTCATHR